MRALPRKMLYRPGPCRQALHKRRRLSLPNRLLILNDFMKVGQMKKKNANQPVGRESSASTAVKPAKLGIASPSIWYQRATKDFTRKLNTSSSVTRFAKIGIANKRVVASKHQPTSTRLKQLWVAAISSAILST